ncbi:hypothetical protein A9Q84_07055 [Halobacteriovorax marinus]|uniref:Uncharacterized protein n=1 Tax=Halobacteriovorax marinus TaxID=97084 RepID=A0A1Y5FA65_9BACT|nr:hypothetical protein A9Q84_07055 [Halobacteriovorax marinus]
MNILNKIKSNRVFKIVIVFLAIYLGFDLAFEDEFLSKLQHPGGRHDLFGDSFQLSEEVLENYIITKYPIAYERNRPNYSNVSNYIKSNSDTSYYEDRRLLDLHKSCGNCIGKDRLITPRRIGYVKAETKLKVLYKFYYKYEERMLSSNNKFYYYIVQDVESGQKYEIRDNDLKDIIKKGSTNLRDDAKLMVKTVKGFKDGKMNSIYYCLYEGYYSEYSFNQFLGDFKLSSEIKFDFKSKESLKHYICLDISFKTVEAYLTFAYYISDW